MPAALAESWIDLVFAVRHPLSAPTWAKPSVIAPPEPPEEPPLPQAVSSTSPAAAAAAAAHRFFSTFTPRSTVIKFVNVNTRSWSSEVPACVPLARAGALPDDQLGYDHGACVPVAPVHPAGQQAERAPADFDEVLAHRGQRRREVRRLGYVVEARDAHVPRHRDAGFGEGAQQAERHLVVAGEDGVQVAFPGEGSPRLVA